jgi:DNA-binding XRE family transcriptional regulator
MITKSNYIENSAFRLKNKKWLKYSSNIARRIYVALLSDQKMTQKQLAEIIDVKPQYISKVLKGQENLSLQTIAKISDALGVELISFPDYKYTKNYIAQSAINHSCKVVKMDIPSFKYDKQSIAPLVLSN